MSSTIPRLYLTPGDPAGVGPELSLKIALLPWRSELIFIVDPEVMQLYADLLDIDIQIIIWSPSLTTEQHKPGVIKVYPVNAVDEVKPGKLSKANAPYVIETLNLAIEQLLQENTPSALITGPVHKGIINQAGIPFTGHTEFLAEKSATEQVIMMLACSKFRVALVTTHLPLRDVPDAITKQKLHAVITLLQKEMQEKFQLDDPMIHICGLNPHAGESGHLGREEIEVIEPVLKALKDKGIKLKGPLPADTALTPAGLEGADVTLAMYHDQGLSVLKYAGFGKAVNITLGLPFLRISVDHGTALDLAGSGKAKTGSMETAINQAISMLSKSRDVVT